MKLHAVDLSIIIAYLLAVFTVGFFNNKQNGSLDYVLMGRKLTLPAFVMTLVSTWYGGILGVSEFSTSYGISNWVVFGLPYYVFGIGFALLIAKRARNLGVSSLPEILRKDYGVGAGRLSSIWVLLLANPAPYVLTLGFLMNYFFGISLWVSIILGAAFSLVYIYRGGFSSVVNTDRIQFSLMFVGFLILLVSLTVKYMNPLELWAALPESHRSLTGGHSPAYILVWFFIASWTLVDPGFHQRVYATTSPAVAKRGILFAVCFWFIFDAMTTLTGLYAFSYLAGSTAPSQAFLELGYQILPIGLQGVFFAAILATVMSTLDSNTLVSGIVIGQDLLFDTSLREKYSGPVIIRISMLVVFILSLVLAIYLPSVIDLWYTFGTIAIPALLLPTLFSIVDRPLPGKAVRLNLIIPPLVSMFWFNFGKVDEWSYLYGLEPFYPGVMMSVLIVLIFNRTKGIQATTV